MTTTKRQLAEQVLRRISGGDVSDDTAYDMREIMRIVEQAVAQLVRANYFQDLVVGRTGIGAQYISTFRSIPVNFDQQLALSYIELPCNYLDLPNDMGLHMIAPMMDQTNAFVPMQNGAQTLFNLSPAGRLEGRIGYWSEGLRAYFKENLLAIGCTSVLVKLVVGSLSTVDADAAYPIGTDMELPVIEQALRIMGVGVAPDVANDNNPAR